MPIKEIRIVLQVEGDANLTDEIRDEIARDACAEILRRHGRLGYQRMHGGVLAGVRYDEYEWGSSRYPGEGEEWAVTRGEREEYENDYDDDDF